MKMNIGFFFLQSFNLSFNLEFFQKWHFILFYFIQYLALKIKILYTSRHVNDNEKKIDNEKLTMKKKLFL